MGEQALAGIEACSTVTREGTAKKRARALSMSGACCWLAFRHAKHTQHEPSCATSRWFQELVSEQVGAGARSDAGRGSVITWAGGGIRRGRQGCGWAMQFIRCPAPLPPPASCPACLPAGPPASWPTRQLGCPPAQRTHDSLLRAVDPDVLQAGTAGSAGKGSARQPVMQAAARLASCNIHMHCYRPAGR